MANRHIIVVVGSEPALEVDLSVFDAVRQATGVGYTRLVDPTLQEFTDHMQLITAQDDGSTAIDCHIAARMNPTGIQFRDQIVTPAQLSPHLSGVQNLFLAGCESATIGTTLAVVPFILTLLEDIKHSPAQMLAKLFWMAIGAGYTTPEAYQTAIKRMPAVAPFTFLHDHHSFLVRKK